jgi:hypothetical protein
MKLSAVYKSTKRADTYLYVEQRNDFSKVPDVLMKQFGEPIFVMLIPLQKRLAKLNNSQIAGITSKRFIEKLESEGFYLQLPPKPENLLKGHLEGAEIRETTNKPE